MIAAFATSLLPTPAVVPAVIDVQASQDLLITFLLVMARALAFFAIAPPFASKQVPKKMKGTMAFAIALAATGPLAGTATFPTMGSIILAALYQLVTGAFMGFTVLLLFTALQSAGDLFDVFSMFTMSSMFDPLSNTSSGVFGRIQNLVGTTLLFASGGHLLLIKGVMSSFEVAPLHAPGLGEATKLLVDNLSTYFVAAMEIAGPVAAVMVLADLALGLVSRAVPSLNVFQLAFPVKTLLAVAIASISVSLLPGAVAMILDRIMEDIGPLNRLLGG